MTSEASTREFVLPTGAADGSSGALSGRAASLSDLRLGFLWNGKPNGDALFDEFLAAVGHPENRVERYLKQSAAIPALDDMYDDLAEKCQAAVVALGD